jgi:integrase
MSIERVERKDGSVVWRVRWRQAGQNRSKVLGRKRDAEAFDAELRRKKRTGEIAALDAGKETLAEFGEDWWKLYAEPNLAASTLKVYAILWDTHVLPRLGSLRLREITPSIVTRFRLELEAAGVGRVSIHKSMTLLQGVLQRACEWDRLASNPARAVRKPTAARTRAVEPLTPDAVEAIRAWLLDDGLLRDATLVSVLAYAGLRPGEALALTWSHVRDGTLLIESAVSEGVASETKTRRRRTVRLLPPLRADLGEWRMAAGRPPEDALVFPGHDGRPWSSAAYKNWHRRFFRPAIAAAGLAGARPYDLRHSFVSLLIAEGHNVVEVARQAGHAPKMALDTYAHVFEEFDPAERIDAAERIRKAREDLRLRTRQPTLFDVA